MSTKYRTSPGGHTGHFDSRRVTVTNADVEEARAGVLSARQRMDAELLRQNREAQRKDRADDASGDPRIAHERMVARMLGYAAKKKDETGYTARKVVCSACSGTSTCTTCGGTGEANGRLPCPDCWLPPGSSTPSGRCKPCEGRGWIRSAAQK